MKKLIVLLLLFCSITNYSIAQNKNIWLSYGQSKFLYSPGVEFNLFFNNNFGFQIGANTYFQNYDSSQVVNSTDSYSFNFHNTNLGACYRFKYKDNHVFSFSTGVKMYYGANFEFLYFYEQGGYPIYYDSSELRPHFGVDLGISYSYKRISTLIKFDTARERFRFGIGYYFGKDKSEK